MAKHIIKDTQKSQIDVYLLWKVFQGNLIKILVVAVLAAGIAGLYRYTNTVPYYSTDVSFIVTGVQMGYDLSGQLTINTITSGGGVGASIAYNAPYIINGDRSLDNIVAVMQEMNPDSYTDVSRRGIGSMININVDNQVVTVSVVNTSKQVVLDVAYAIKETVPACMDYYFGIENPDETENIASVCKAINNVSEENVVPHGRNTAVFTLMGFLVGAVLVYLLCLLRAYFDNTVYNEEDLKSRFDIPVIGQIPTWENTQSGAKAFKDKSRRDRHKGTKDAKAPDGGNLMSDRDYENRILNKNTPFAITEAFKHLRTNMCYTTKGESCAVYGVTSAYVSAGKSMIISNTAVSFSMMNKKVLLVDCDLRCPVQHKIFKLDNKVHGMSDLLGGICKIEDVPLRRMEGYDNLDIITSGRIPPNPAELLASDNMKKFIEYAKAHYDIVFIDLPPVCEVSDAGIISDLVTGYTFIVRSGYSDRRMIEVAVETMEAFDASFVGFILNDIDIKSGDYYKNKYYSSYSKYRFRYGKQGYYRHFKYGYYKGYYKREYKNAYNSSYSNSYKNSMEEVNANPLDAILAEDRDVESAPVQPMTPRETTNIFDESFTETASETKAPAETAQTAAPVKKPRRKKPRPAPVEEEEVPFRSETESGNEYEELRDDVFGTSVENTEGKEDETY